jgi:hypothetical protein
MYAIIPPRYDREASINKNNQGVDDLDAQAINISGGISPKIVSDTRKTRNITFGE